MCEIFPEVDSCCATVSIRVGMMLIATLSITTGAVTLGVLEQKTNVNYNRLFEAYGSVANITDASQVLPNLFNLICACIVFISFVFMFAGITCLFSTLTDQEGFAQMFVWLVFLNIFIGYVVVIAISFQCCFMNQCLLGDMDWLSTSSIILAIIAYLLMWYYFCCVANSYVLEPHT